MMLATILAACQETDAPMPRVEQTFLFWTSGNDNAIFRTALDSKGNATQIDTLFSAADGIVSPASMVVDEAAQMLYWTDVRTGEIVRAPMDGRRPPEVLYTVPPDIPGPVGLTFDAILQRLYWTQPWDDLILGAPAYPGGEVDTLLTGADGIDGSWGIALQAGAGALYWIEYLDVELNRAWLSQPAAVQTLYAGGSGFLRPFAVAVQGDALFIVDNPIPGTALPDRILRGDAGGAKPLETLYDEGVDNAMVLAVEPASGMLYWLNQLEDGSIWRGSITGDVPPVKIVDHVHFGEGLAVAVLLSSNHPML